MWQNWLRTEYYVMACTVMACTVIACNSIVISYFKQLFLPEGPALGLSEDRGIPNLSACLCLKFVVSLDGLQDICANDANSSMSTWCDHRVLETRGYGIYVY